MNLQATREGTKVPIATTMVQELRQTARLGGPLALGELGWMSTYIVDALMIGRLPHSAIAISASSLGNTIFYTIAFCAMGLLTGLDTLVAQASGRGDRTISTHALTQAMWFVVVGTPAVVLLTFGFLALLPVLGTPADIAAETARYLHALVWSTPALILYWAFRQYLQATGRAVLIMVALVSAAGINFVGDWVFLYGHLGFRAMGIAGSGWATLIVRIAILAMIVPGVVRGLREAGVPVGWGSFRPDWRILRTQFRVGWPTSLQSITDYGFSTFLSIVCARLGAVMLAGHQVVLDLDAFVYQVPNGLSFATITRVGQAAGRESVSQVERAARASLVLSVTYALVAAALFAGLPRFWAGLYTNDAGAVAAAAPVFLICAFIQVGDSVAVIFGNAMAGLGDTRTPFLTNTLWYWLAGMPLATWFCFSNGLGLRGLWLGRALASIGTAVTVTVLWHRRMRRLRSPETHTALNLLTPVRARV